MSFLMLILYIIRYTVLADEAYWCAVGNTLYCMTIRVHAIYMRCGAEYWVNWIEQVVNIDLKVPNLLCIAPTNTSI